MREKEPHTQTPAASPVVTAAARQQTIAPAPTPVPVVTPEPTPVYTFIGQAYCNAKESVNIRAEANTESDDKRNISRRGSGGYYRVFRYDGRISFTAASRAM